jgi:hypothetical protein
MSFYYVNKMENIIANEYGKIIQKVNDERYGVNLTISTIRTNENECKQCLAIFMNEDSLKDMLPCKKDYNNSSNELNNLTYCNNFNRCPNNSECRQPTLKTRQEIDLLRGVIRKNNNIEFNKNAVCNNRCQTTVSNVDLKNSINFKSSTEILPTNEVERNKILEQLVTECENKMKDSFGEEYNQTTENREKILNLVKSINIEEVFNDVKIVNTVQSFNVTGAGNISNVKMSILLNVLYDSVHNSNVQNKFLFDLANEMIEDVKNTVRKETVTEFTNAFQELKKEFIILGVFIALSILLIIIFIIRKAMRG